MRINDNDNDDHQLSTPPKHLVFAYYITGHGFGHATTRVFEVTWHLISAGHDVHVVTGAPDFVFTSEIQFPRLFIRFVGLWSCSSRCFDCGSTCFFGEVIPSTSIQEHAGNEKSCTRLEILLKELENVKESEVQAFLSRTGYVSKQEIESALVRVPQSLRRSKVTALKKILCSSCFINIMLVFAGYVGDDEATTSTMDSDGWLKTGDLCYIDSDGFLYIVDRLKELIKYKAYQVPPTELEHLLQSHPKIAYVALIPYPDEEAGQIPMAFVVRKTGSNLSAAQVMEFVAK
ncbi:hypothetical protein IFM89_015325 [Coptis chinensis]|uniref:AMP-binding enzyme C-terminal domain-containing protein n=1 Tax=Coptis chinensis TaxID=261450 RepID=A0A835IQB0_9MAGN|nr:hypothetical protein IFM89_015325 [Coptis chinensis]